MSTSGLIVVRELGPLSFARQLNTGALAAPGRSGPTTTATRTAAAASARPLATSERLPGPFRPASQLALSSRRATLMNSTNRRTVARYSAESVSRLRL